MARRTGAIRNILVATDLQADSRAGVEMEGLLASQLERERETARKRAEGARLSTRLLWGRHPAAEVMAAAADGAYDLIVVGTHGRGPLVRALIGSVALALAQSAPCPVLVVPPGS